MSRDLCDLPSAKMNLTFDWPSHTGVGCDIITQYASQSFKTRLVLIDTERLTWYREPAFAGLAVDT